MQVMSSPPATNRLNSHAAWLSGRGVWEAGEDYLWSKDNEKKKKGCLILNSNTWRITDRLVLFLLCQVTLLACTGQRLVGRGSDKTLCKIHCFSMQRVSHDKWKWTNTISPLLIHYTWGVNERDCCKAWSTRHKAIYCRLNEWER